MPDIAPPHLDLQATAKQLMQEHGFDPDFPASVATQVASLKGHSQLGVTNGIRDLRTLLWSSIDNDTSRDLDQIEVAERISNGDVRVMIGIADIDAFVSKLTAIDVHAARAHYANNPEKPGRNFGGVQLGMKTTDFFI